MRQFIVENFKRLSGHPSVSSRFDNELEKVRKARHVDLRLIAVSLWKSHGGESQRVLYNAKSEPIGIVDTAT